MKKSEEFTFMTGWIAAFMLLAVFFIATVTTSSSLRDIACDAEEKNCYREWLSALGGWAAFAIAIPSVIFLGRQVQQAQQHHRDRLVVDLRQSVALAENAKHEADTIESIVGMLQDMRESAGMPGLRTIQSEIETILQLISSQTFTSLEIEIECPKGYRVGLLRKIATSIIDRNTLIFTGHHPIREGDIDTLEADTDRLFTTTLGYARDVIEISDRHIETYQALIGRQPSSTA